MNALSPRWNTTRGKKAEKTRAGDHAASCLSAPGEVAGERDGQLPDAVRDTAYVTMNSDEHGYPFEVFHHRAGQSRLDDLQADAEGLGRMISLQLRTTAEHNRREMLKLIIDQLQDIGGARPIGFGPNRVLSLPDAVARALQEHYFDDESPRQLGLPINGNSHESNTDDESASKKAPEPQSAVSEPTVATSEQNGHADGYVSGADMCPECGTVTLIRAEGCRKCLTCGYSEC